MSGYHTSSSTNSTGCGVQKCYTFTQVGGNTSVFVAPISDCGDFVILRIITTEKKMLENDFGVILSTRYNLFN